MIISVKKETRRPMKKQKTKSWHEFVCFPESPLVQVTIKVSALQIVAVVIFVSVLILSELIHFK